MRTRLIIRGIGFSLFYDYDQLREGKLSKLTALERAEWFTARHRHFFFRPQRWFWVSDRWWSRGLALFVLPYGRLLSAKIVMFGGLLNAVEAMGGFVDSSIRGRGRNWQRFRAFTTGYMPMWDKQIAVGSSNQDLVKFLWRRHRNGVAHGFQIEGGGIEYLPEGTRFEVRGNHVWVCPRQFLADYRNAFTDFMRKVNSDQEVLTNFSKRFLEIYPC